MRRELRRLPQQRPQQRFTTHSAEGSIFLERVDDGIRKHPGNCRGECIVSVKDLEHGYIQSAVYRPTHEGTDGIARVGGFKHMNKHAHLQSSRVALDATYNA